MLLSSSATIPSSQRFFLWLTRWLILKPSFSRTDCYLTWFPSSGIAKVGHFEHDDMTAVVKASGGTTDDIVIRNGLRQGCTKGPVLFNLYFAAMVACWRATVLGLGSLRGIGWGGSWWRIGLLKQDLRKPRLLSQSLLMMQHCVQ